MKHVLEVYKYARAAEDTVPGIKPLVEQFAVSFDRPNRPSSGTANPGTPPSGAGK
jgi:hypothetical protein